MKKNILLLIFISLVFGSLKPIVEDKAKKTAIISGVCAGALGGIVSAYGLHTILKNSNNVSDTQVRTVSISGSLISASIAYWATYKFIMNLRPTVSISKLKSFFEEVETFFIFKLDFKLGLNEELFSTVSDYYKDKSDPLVSFRIDLDNIYNGIISNKEFLEKNKQDFIYSGLKQDYFYLESKLNEFKSYIRDCISSVEILDLKLFSDRTEKFFAFGLDFSDFLSKELIAKINSHYHGKDCPLVLFINDLNFGYNRIISKIDFLVKSKQNFISSGFDSDYSYLESRLNYLKLYTEDCCSKVKMNDIYYSQLNIYKLEQQVRSLKGQLSSLQGQVFLHHVFSNHY